MKKILSIFVVCLIAVQSALAAPFIEGFEDLPFPDTLHQIPADNLSFGNEETSLVEAYLSGDLRFDEVEKFYLDTLPQLGWSFSGKKNKILSFVRENQQLEIAQEGTNPLVIRITVKSQN